MNIRRQGKSLAKVLPLFLFSFELAIGFGPTRDDRLGGKFNIIRIVLHDPVEIMAIPGIEPICDYFFF
jgi:hypothetical protein